MRRKEGDGSRLLFPLNEGGNSGERYWKLNPPKKSSVRVVTISCKRYCSEKKKKELEEFQKEIFKG